MQFVHNGRRGGERRRRKTVVAGWLGLLVLWAFVSTLCPDVAEPVGRCGRSAEAAERENQVADTGQEAKQPSHAKPGNRADSIRALLARVGLGEGSVIADIGAGGGQDTWVFAEVVGETGKVYAEEIGEDKVKSLEGEAEKKGLARVHPLLGQVDDPCLPEGSVDLAFMHRVYHHLSEPRKMLRGIRRGLKPGGYLVVVDQRRGTLQDWIPRQQRKDKHFWIAETTVVREAREEGYLFVACPDDCWHEDAPFAVIVQRPKEPAAGQGDPDPFLPVAWNEAGGHFLPLGKSYSRPVFIALGEARELIAPVLHGSSGPGLDIVLEEWATQKDERPPLPPNVSLPSVLTDGGDPHLGPEPVDAVFFLDSYHLLFHGKTLLAKIHERLQPAGCVYVLDREAKEPLSRREASHRRKIEAETVKREMAAAGFSLWFEGPRPAADRFLLVFGKTRPEELAPATDPFIAGPVIAEPPGPWLQRNRWRLRGLKAADGTIVSLTPAGRSISAEKVLADAPGTEAWKIPGEELILAFEKRGDSYLLKDYQRPVSRP